MKNILIRRITILISTAVFISSILIASLGVYLIEGSQADKIQTLVQTLFISIAIIIPFVAALSYLVLRRIIKPVKSAINVAISMSQGDFSVRADENLKDEIGLLGKTLNKMSIDLYRNVSQLFIEKNRLCQVLNGLDEGVMAVDENRYITHYNKVFLEMFSLKENEVKDRCIDDIDVLKKELHELSQATECKYTIVTNCVCGDVIMRIAMSSIENEKNEVVGAVVLFRDITELEKLEKVRREYVANVSHELRSPLTSIRGLIEPLMDSVVTDEEDVKRYHKIIYQESMRLSRLVDDIMELSRLQSNQPIEKTSVDINSVIEMVHERYKLSNDHISLIYNPVILPKVYANYDRIEQILVILLDNAYKFTPEGGKIEIFTEERVNDVIVSVRDSGIGIAEDELECIFDRFYKSDKSRSKKGSGLGLSIAREILSIMGEKINVRSIYGCGSTFEFTVHKKEN